jgi:hypothetical protein
MPRAGSHQSEYYIHTLAPIEPRDVRWAGVPKVPQALKTSLVVGALVVTGGTTAFFWPLLHGSTFSTVAGHQSSVYPWRAYANPYVDYPQSDQADLNYPWQAFLTRSLRSGDPPFWNPLSFGGQPFLSNGSSAVIYPPRLLAALVLSPSGAHDLLSVFHVFGAGLAMFLLCRQLRVGTAGSLLGATSWMFASFNLAWLHLEVVAPVMVFLPLSLLLVRRAVEAPAAGNVLGAALVLGSSLVSGHLLFMVTVWAVAVGYGVACLVSVAFRAWRGRRGRDVVWSGARLAVVALGGPALFAFILLPTALTMGASHRRPLTYEEVHESERSEPRVLLEVFRPPPLPVTERLMNRDMAFVGTTTGVLALLGALCRGPAPALGRVLAPGVLLLALDTPVLRLADALVPSFTLFRPLGRLFFLLNFAVALLGAVGLEALVAAVERRRRRWSEGPAGPSSRRVWLAAAFQQAVVPALVLVNAAQLVSYGRAVNPPFHPRTEALLFPQTPIIRAADQHVRMFKGRLFPLHDVRPDGVWTPPMLPASDHMIFGLPSAGGYDSVVPERALHVWLVVKGMPVEQVLQNPGVGAYLSDFPVSSVRFELLPRLGVTAIAAARGIRRSPYWPRTEPLRLQREYAGPDGALYSIEDAPGPAWLAPWASLVDTPGDALRRLADPAFDFRREVILLRSEAPSAPGTASGPVAAGYVRIESKTNNRLLVRVVSSTGGWLVVPDTWDRGWRATLNERPAAVLQANYAFRAVRVPPGEHRVEMRYVPVGFLPGLFCSAAAVLAAVAAARPVMKRRRGPAGPEREELEARPG